MATVAKLLAPFGPVAIVTGLIAVGAYGALWRGVDPYPVLGLAVFLELVILYNEHRRGGYERQRQEAGFDNELQGSGKQRKERLEHRLNSRRIARRKPAPKDGE